MKARVPPTLMRLGAQQVGRRVLNPRLPWEVQRRRLDKLVASWPLPRGTSVSTTAWNGIPVEIISTGRASSRSDSVPAGQITGPPSGTDAVTVVHFHGGGYCVGSAAEARDWAAHLSAQAGCRVVLPEYRLAPEHPYPAALDDARAVVAAALGEADYRSVIVSGDSAGGGLALATALALAGSTDGPRLAGCILLSPWLDLCADRAGVPELVRRDVLLSPSWLEACAQAYAPIADRTQPMVSPLYADLAGLPPLLVQCGADDLLAPDAERLAARAAAADLDISYSQWPGMWHDFALQPDLVTAAARAVTEAASFVMRVAATNLGLMRGAPHAHSGHARAGEVIAIGAASRHPHRQRKGRTTH
jgi:epsilon-lactone hydrolase